MTNHKDCPGVLKATFAEGGGDITVSTARPLVPGPYTTDPFVCPHGTAYWVEPTGEQIAAWAAAGTR